jgi:hypothetical protein
MSRRRRKNSRGRGGRHPKPSLLRRIFTNRRDPNSSWVFLADVIDNIREEIHCFLYRVPRGSRLLWDRNGRIRGHATIRRY